MARESYSDIYFHGKFYRNGIFDDLYIGVSNGKISEISKFRNNAKVVELENAVFPGSTDMHVHFRDPGETEKEDFTTGSISAIFGGTTTVFDMPNNMIPIVDYEVYESKRNALKGRSFCDYGLYSMFNGGNETVIHEESVGVKIYMGESTNAKGVENIDEKIQSSLDNLGKNIVFHGESGECLKKSNVALNNMCDHSISRNTECERIAVDKLNKFRISRKIMAHLSDFNNVELIKNQTFKTEILPQHMLLSCEKLENSWGKVNPPIRDEKIREKNFQAYLDGKIDVLSSDHAPHTERDKGELKYAKSGMIGVETRVPLILALIRKKIVPLSIFVKTAIETPPLLFGIKKGLIEKGYQADFFTVDFSSIQRISEEKLHSKNPFTPFHGFEAIFPKDVILGGEIALQGRELIEDHFGKYIPLKKPEVV